MKKVRILSAVLACLFLFSLTACSSPKTGPTDPFEGLTLLERYEKNDPNVIGTATEIERPFFDRILYYADFYVIASFVERDVEGHRDLFKVEANHAAVRTKYRDTVIIERGDLLYTAAEPYDLVVEDVNTHDKEYRYIPVMDADSYKVGEQYVILGTIDPADNTPVPYYGFCAPLNDLKNTELWGINVFTGGEGCPPSQLQLGAPWEPNERSEFLGWMSAAIHESLFETAP